MKYLYISFIWAGYCFLHSYLISGRFTKFTERLLKNYYAWYRLFYVLLSLVLLVPLIRYTNAMDNRIIIEWVSPWSVIRIILMYGSLLMFFWAFFFNYDSLSFFGIRQIMNFGKTKNTNPSAGIKKNGLLGVIRHPMYLCLIIYLWCQTFRMVDIIVNVILTVYVIIGTILEEKKLILEFGDYYKKYQQEVPMLIPFIKRLKSV
jgi:methanethiol S-methyltransferase